MKFMKITQPFQLLHESNAKVHCHLSTAYLFVEKQKQENIGDLVNTRSIRL